MNRTEASAARGPQVHLTIDRLVLRIAPVAGHAALTAELRQRLTAPGASQALGPSRRRAAIAAGPVRSAAAGSAVALGRSFAGALAAGLAEHKR